MKMTLKGARANANLTQKQVAEYIGVSIPMVHKWESGETIPKVTTVLKMCDLYGCDIQNLVF